MKIILVLCAIVACALAYQQVEDYESDIEKALQFAKCFHQALEDGVPEISLPKSNPYIIEGSSFLVDMRPFGICIAVGNLTWGGEIDGLLDYTLSDVHGIPPEHPEKLSMTYKLFWKEVSVKLLARVLDTQTQGSIEFVSVNFTLTDIEFAGEWKMTKADHQEHRPAHLDEFTVISNVGEVTATLDSILGKSAALEGVLADDLKWIVNSYAEYLSARFANFVNTYWFEHPERIEAILKHCPSN